MDRNNRRFGDAVQQSTLLALKVRVCAAGSNWHGFTAQIKLRIAFQPVKRSI